VKAAKSALPAEARSGDALGVFGRWLTLWVFLLTERSCFDITE
jgi:hypothetical protein